MKKLLFIMLASALLFTSCRLQPGEKEVTQGTEYKNVKIAWGIKKIEGSPPQVPAAWAELLKRFDGFYTGDTSLKKLFLTFDEGYENGNTAKILDILKEKNVPAAFFITGQYLKEEALVKRMAQEGHIVGNHTVNHPSMPDVKNDKKLEKEITDLNDRFFSLTGKSMKYIRPPRGEFSEKSLAVSQKLGYKTILWSNAYVDWVSNGNSSRNALEQVTKYFHNGSIILLHAVSKENTEALPEIINFAVRQGYSFASLDDL